MPKSAHARALQLAANAAAQALKAKAAVTRRAQQAGVPRDKITRVGRSDKPEKRFAAHFSSGRTTHFGDPQSRTFLDHGDKARRLAYRTRHQKDLRTHDPYRAGYLSYFLLWGSHRTMAAAVAAYNRRLF